MTKPTLKKMRIAQNLTRKNPLSSTIVLLSAVGILAIALFFGFLQVGVVKDVLAGGSKGKIPRGNMGPVKSDLQPSQAVLAEFDSLKNHLLQVLESDFKNGWRVSLLNQLEHSRKEYERGEPCEASRKLKTYFVLSHNLKRHGLVELGAELLFRGQLLRAEIIAALGDGETCSGQERVGSQPEITVLHSDNTAFAATVTFGEPLQSPASGGGEHFVELIFPGLEVGISLGGHQANGQPGIPVFHRLLAVPMGATAVLSSQVRLPFLSC
ncbi:MAG: hypothetical protein Q8P24_08115 [Desulfobacterales bacterium]|nr:hypothetical protein [Desulfobacterales bacterium]